MDNTARRDKALQQLLSRFSGPLDTKKEPYTYSRINQYRQAATRIVQKYPDKSPETLQLIAGELGKIVVEGITLTPIIPQEPDIRYHRSILATQRYLMVHAGQPIGALVLQLASGFQPGIHVDKIMLLSIAEYRQLRSSVFYHLQRLIFRRIAALTLETNLVVELNGNKLRIFNDTEDSKRHYTDYRGIDHTLTVAPKDLAEHFKFVNRQALRILQQLEKMRKLGRIPFDDLEYREEEIKYQQHYLG